MATVFAPRRYRPGNPAPAHTTGPRAGRKCPARGPALITSGRDVHGDLRAIAGHDGRIAAGALVPAGAAGDREPEGSRTLLCVGDQAGQVDLAVGEDHGESAELI